MNDNGVRYPSTRAWERAQFESLLEQAASDACAEDAIGTGFLLYLHGISGVGKTTLLGEFERIADAKGVPWVNVNARSAMFSEELFANDLLRALAGDACPDDLTLSDAYRNAAAAANSRASGSPLVLAIDQYEYAASRDASFREHFLGRLSPSVQFVAAGTSMLPPHWFTHLGARRRIKTLEISTFPYEEVLRILSARGLDESAQEAVWNLTQGHALSIVLSLSMLESRSPVPLELMRKNLHQEMAKHWYRGISDEPLKELVTASSLLFQFNQETLEYLVQARVSAERFRLLTTLPFIRPSAKGWYVHDLVREAVRSDFQDRLPNRYREWMERCARYYYHTLIHAFRRNERDLGEAFFHFYYYTGDESLRELYYSGNTRSGNYYEPMLPSMMPEVQTYIRDRKRTMTAPAELIAMNGMTVEQHQRLTGKEYDVIQPQEFLELGERSVRLLRNAKKELIGLSVVLPLDPHLRQAAALPVVGTYLRTHEGELRASGKDGGTSWFLRINDCMIPMNEVAIRTDVLRNFLSYLAPNRYIVTSTAFPGLAKVYERLGFKEIPGEKHTDFGPEFPASFFALDLRGERFLRFLEDKMRDAGYALPSGDALPLTPREKEISELILACMTNEAIAAELFISVVTVKKHIGNLLRKAGVKNRAQYIRRMMGDRGDRGDHGGCGSGGGGGT